MPFSFRSVRHVVFCNVEADVRQRAEAGLAFHIVARVIILLNLLSTLAAQSVSIWSTSVNSVKPGSETCRPTGNCTFVPPMTKSRAMMRRNGRSRKGKVESPSHARHSHRDDPDMTPSPP